MRNELNYDRRRFLGVAAMSVAGARFGAVGAALEQLGCAANPSSGRPELSSLARATEWLNSQPLTTDALKEKVVLVDFGTYSCINWLRTLPYVRAWAEKYRNQGLVMIGVQTPEFEFEKDVAGVRRAVKDMRVEYPIAIDNDYTIWNAFSNQYWPALYFIDANGRIRHHRFGEGDYDKSERTIQELLADAGARDIGRDLVSIEGSGIEAAADWSNLKSPENYLGYARTENFASPGGADRDRPRIYSLPARVGLNQWAAFGNWTMKRQPLALNAANGRIAYRFHARDLHLVMGPPAGGSPVRFRVLIDGQPPGGAHGSDVDPEGNGTAVHQRLYQLIRQPKPIDDRLFEIEFFDAGIEAFAFTFG